MSNVKAQSPNQAQMSKKRKIFGILSFVIDLTFACLPQAGILKFVIWDSKWVILKLHLFGFLDK
jgi:hypothetical protein